MREITVSLRTMELMPMTSGVMVPSHWLSLPAGVNEIVAALAVTLATVMLEGLGQLSGAVTWRV